MERKFKIKIMKKPIKVYAEFIDDIRENVKDLRIEFLNDEILLMTKNCKFGGFMLSNLDKKEFPKKGTKEYKELLKMTFETLK